MHSDLGIPTLIITGPVGVGKTSVAGQVSNILGRAGVPHALVDLDALRSCVPHPPGDPFHIALGMRNLAAVWTNFRAAGATHLVLADVVETNAEIVDYAKAVPGAAIQIVRLRALIPTIWERLSGRDTGPSLAWHRQRAVELSELMEQRRIGDIVVDTEGKSIEIVALEILDRCKWSANAASFASGFGDGEQDQQMPSP